MLIETYYSTSRVSKVLTQSASGNTFQNGCSGYGAASIRLREYMVFKAKCRRLRARCGLYSFFIDDRGCDCVCDASSGLSVVYCKQ